MAAGAGGETLGGNGVPGIGLVACAGPVAGAGPVVGVIIGTERVGRRRPRGQRVACPGLVAVLVASAALLLGAHGALLLGAHGAGSGHAGQRGPRPPLTASRSRALGPVPA